MNMTIVVPEFKEGGSLLFEWDDNFEISLNRTTGEVVVAANVPGLISLARHLLTLAQDSVPNGSHLHLSDLAELEDGSGDLILEKRP